MCHIRLLCVVVYTPKTKPGSVPVCHLLSAPRRCCRRRVRAPGTRPPDPPGVSSLGHVRSDGYQHLGALRVPTVDARCRRCPGRRGEGSAVGLNVCFGRGGSVRTARLCRRRPAYVIFITFEGTNGTETFHMTTRTFRLSSARTVLGPTPFLPYRDWAYTEYFSQVVH